MIRESAEMPSSSALEGQCAAGRAYGDVFDCDQRPLKGDVARDALRWRRIAPYAEAIALGIEVMRKFESSAVALLGKQLLEMGIAEFMRRPR